MGIKTLSLLLALLAGIYIDYSRLIRDIDTKNAELQSAEQRIELLVSASLASEQMIKLQEANYEKEREASLEAGAVRRRMEALASTALLKIEQDIVYAPCADLPIPNSDTWLYYDTASNRGG